MERCTPPPAERAVYVHQLDELHAGLGEAVFEQTWATGQAMTLEQAYTFVVSQPIPDKLAPGPEEETSPSRQSS